MHALLGQKIDQSQRFLEDGTRVPVTVVAVADNPVVAVRTEEKNGYSAVQLGYGTAKKPTKSLTGIAKKANLNTTPRFFREIKIADDTLPAIGDLIKATDIFKPGDIIQVTGISKGKGWAGVVKRHHFKGGPRTHGQSDRERAPGSIGQTTTPGRVYKGKRMAGRMGHEKVTVKNLTIVDVTDSQLLIAGLIPGPVNNIVLVTKTGEKKKFVPLYSDKKDEPEEVSVSPEPVAEETAEVTSEQAPKEEAKAEVATEASQETASNAAEADGASAAKAIASEQEAQGETAPQEEVSAVKTEAANEEPASDEAQTDTSEVKEEENAK